MAVYYGQQMAEKNDGIGLSIAENQIYFKTSSQPDEESETAVVGGHFPSIGTIYDGC